jgi:hypothetical protein
MISWEEMEGKLREYDLSRLKSIRTGLCLSLERIGKIALQEEKIARETRNDLDSEKKAEINGQRARISEENTRAKIKLVNKYINIKGEDNV